MQGDYIPTHKLKMKKLRSSLEKFISIAYIPSLTFKSSLYEKITVTSQSETGENSILHAS